MEINWQVKHVDGHTVSHLMYSNLKRLLESVRECGKVTFAVKKRTKTTLYVDMFSGDPSLEDGFTVAHVPKGAEDLKYVKTTDYSFFNHTWDEHYYLRIPQKQGLSALKRYLGAVLESLLPEMKTVDVEIVLNDVPELSI